MKYYLLEPEVAGGFGDHVVLDTSVHPPLVRHLHYEFADWFGDDLVCTFPVFLVTEALAKRLTASGLPAFALKDVEITLSPEAEEILEGRALPRFVWWQVTGRPGVDDFGVTDKADLVVSDQGLAVLTGGSQLDNCDITPYER